MTGLLPLNLTRWLLILTTVCFCLKNQELIHADEMKVSYRHEIMSILTKLGCNSGPCHGNLTGKGGLKLSLRGESPAEDWLVLTHGASARRISTTNPKTSLLLAKPAGDLAHEGGIRFSEQDQTYQKLEQWIQEGATDDADQAANPTELLVTPDMSWKPFQKSNRLSIRVIASWGNGQKKDVTDLASFDINDPSGAEISANGEFTVDRPGEWVVGVRYLGLHGLSRIVVYEENPDYVWTGPDSDHPLDKAIFSKLKKLQQNPSKTASPEILIRRLYLDLLGILPPPDEVRKFLADTSPDRYEKLVEKILNRPEFADYWALKWSDLLRNEPKAMGPKGNWQFHRWLRDQFSQDRPMTEFARELITSTGSTWTNPASSFHRTSRDPETSAETFAQVFLGYRFQCAKCHNHPSDIWTQDDYYGLAATFANLRRKDINNIRRDRFDKHEVNGDVVVYFQGPPEIVQPRSGEILKATPPGGQKVQNPDQPQAALNHLANWLTDGNRQFARNIANRVWYQLIGKGVVDPVDDFRDSNPPSNPALLDALEKAFVDGGYRIKPLARLIVSSQSYRLSSDPARHYPAGEANFGRAIVRLLPAEILRDIVDQATGYTREQNQAPDGTRALQMAAANNRGEEFMKIFGKPERLLSCECERSEETTLAQAFQLINGETIRQALESNNNRIPELEKMATVSMEKAITELFLASLSRDPTEAEIQTLTKFLKTANNQRQAWEDIVWATINAKEFLFRH